MADTLKIDKTSTAVLVMDFQSEIVDMLPADRRGPVVDNAEAIIAKARATGIPVMYVVVRFREGYPEVCSRNKGFSALKNAGRLVEGTKGADIHPRLAPRAGEPVVTKRRVSSFGTTDLYALLNGKNITNLVLLGLVTGGVVVSTVRSAADLDYSMVVVSDACDDADPEVHRVLMEKLFPRQAEVVTTKALLAAL